jgi:hypothetical protein
MSTQCQSEEELLSDSGRYKVVVTYGGSWASRGLVFRVGEDKPIADIQRNYSSFPATFIENHPNGHPYLIGGANYQGSTVIELDTGRRRDFVPEEAKEGFGFCWAEHRFDAATQLLIVDGCFWACPYMYCFYDFSDPMERGWPQLDFEGALSDGKWPEISADGIVRTYEVEPEPDDAEEDVPVEQRGIAEISTYRRKGNELRFVSRWLSQARQEQNRKRAANERANEAWETEYKATDPLYLEYKRQLTEPGLSPENYMGFGVTHESWCSTFKGNERRWCRRIITEGRCTVELEWAVKTGPIKLVIVTNGKDRSDIFFDHSAKAMVEAFECAKQLAKGASLASFTIMQPWAPQ